MYPSIIKVKTCVILVQFKKLKEIKKSGEAGIRTRGTV